MPAYDPKSRYAKATTYQVVDHRDRVVTVVDIPAHPEQPIVGLHVHRQGQRSDHLASQYLDDNTGFWRLAEANDAMQAEWLTEQTEIAIPVKDLQ
jgi:hypothetical protein